MREISWGDKSARLASSENQRLAGDVHDGERVSCDVEERGKIGLFRD